MATDTTHPQDSLTAFLRTIATDVIDGEVRHYRENLHTRGKDAYWQRVSDFYLALTQEQRETVLALVRQVSIDTAAGIMHILDNGRIVEGVDEFQLIADGQRINDDLLDFFLSKHG